MYTNNFPLDIFAVEMQNQIVWVGGWVDGWVDGGWVVGGWISLEYNQLSPN